MVVPAPPPRSSLTLQKNTPAAPLSCLRLLLLGMTVSGCAGEDPLDFPVALLDRGFVARVSESSDTGPLEPLLNTKASAGGLDAKAWHASQFVQMKPDFSRPPEGANIVGDAVQLGPESGGWLRLLEVPPNTALVIEAKVDGVGLDEMGNSARLAILEFEHPPTESEWMNLAPALRGTHLGEPYQEAGAGVVSMWFHTGENTHSIALGVILSDEGADSTGDRNLRVSFEDFVVRPASHAERLHDVLGDKSVGEFEIGMMRRSASVLGAGDRITLPLAGLSQGNRKGTAFECALGLVPLERDPRRPQDGATLTFDVFFDDQSSTQPIDSFTLSTASRTASRWLPVSIALPALSDGATISIQLRSSLAPEDAPLGLLATPRLVPKTPRRAGPNVVLVSIDTLRADRMSLYGNDRQTTPNIDAFAGGALVFDDVWANGAYTLPSHMSLFTGQTPSMHRVQGPNRKRDPKRSPLLTEVLAARGYTAAAFTGGGFVSPGFGFGDGFESYGTVDPMVNSDSPLLRSQLEKLDGVDLPLLQESDMSSVGRWLESHKRESFFLFLHTYAPHQFDPQRRHLDALGLGQTLSEDHSAQGTLFSMGNDVTEREYQRVFELYDGAVRQADEGFGQLIQQLKALDLLEDTIVILTSDHGKELGEHGAIGHGHALYQEMLSVPLIIRLPGRANCERGTWAPGRSSTPVSLIDIVPTVLEALDLTPWPSLQGMSLLGEIPTRPVMSEVQNLAVKFALREGPTKTIFSPLGSDLYIPNTVEIESFHLANDPLERSPLAVDTKAEAARIQTLFDEISNRSLRLGDTLSAGHLGEDLREQLEALGYLEDARREEARESDPTEQEK